MQETTGKNRINIFLTGATGVMGMAGLKELVKFPERYNITVLARKSQKNIRKMTPFEKKGVKVIWGDLLDRDSIKKGVVGADIILHVGGLVSPLADKYPEKTLETNIGSIKLIVEEAEKVEQKYPERTVKTVYIGSVSQYGSHLPPNHWQGVGSPLSSARFDAYALSKIEGERIISLSKLKKWVSLRQTAILHKGLLMKADDPIMFHVPLKGTIEWVSVEDSGRVLERICRPDVPEDFWCDYYNIGGGKSFRLTNYEFEKKLLKAMGCAPPEKIFEPNWFATDNFHGVWFTDSDRLENILHFRSRETADECFIRIKKQLPFIFSLTPLVPAFIIKLFMKKVAERPYLGPLSWLKNNDTDKIEASWGSLEAYKKISGWKDLKVIESEQDVADTSHHSISKESEGDGSNQVINKEGYLKTNNDINHVTTNESFQYSRAIYFATCPNGHSYLTSEFIEKRGGHSCPDCLLRSLG